VRLRETFKQIGRERLCCAVPDGRWHAGTPDLQSLGDGCYRLIVEYVVALPQIHARLHALERITAESSGHDCPYIPIRFVPSEKLSRYDKLLLAFDAYAFSQVCGKTPHIGRIIHGCQYARVTVRLPDLLRTVRLLLGRIADQQANPTTPSLPLNKHLCRVRIPIAMPPDRYSEGRPQPAFAHPRHFEFAPEWPRTTRPAPL
jgi:hypothetical protein